MATEPKSGVRATVRARAWPSCILRVENDVTLTARELQSVLWEAANILRGSAVDRTDWKGYILPLFFFKRICDVWNEETAEAAETYGDADPSQLPEVHRFQLPDGCHWEDVRATAQNVGTALKHAMQEIERANPDTLYRVFGAADWGNKEKFNDELLKDLIEGFSSISLGQLSRPRLLLGSPSPNEPDQPAAGARFQRGRGSARGRQGYLPA